MMENEILKLEFRSRSEAARKLTEQQSECLDHEIQTNRQPTESHEIQWNQGLRKPHPKTDKIPIHCPYRTRRLSRHPCLDVSAQPRPIAAIMRALVERSEQSSMVLVFLRERGR